MKTKTVQAVTLAFLLATLPVGVTLARQVGPPPVLNPETYLSSSGVYALHVDPSDINGCGPADYRFTKNGEIVWKSRLDFTLWGAVVINSGCVAGYAYTGGIRGLAKTEQDTGDGDFIVILLSPTGEMLGKETTPRTFSRFPDMSPDPVAKGIFVDDANNRFIVRVRDPDINRHIEQWWMFDLNDGKRLDVIEPATLFAGAFILSIKSIPCTPLLLMHLHKVTQLPEVKDKYSWGAIFTLTDPKGNPVWRIDFDDDYTVSSNRKTEDPVQNMILKNGAILDVGQSTFIIYSLKERRKISFAVEKGADGSWTARETLREAWELKSPAAEIVAKPDFPQLNPPKSEIVRLDVKYKFEDRAHPAKSLDHGTINFPEHLTILNDQVYITDQVTKYVHVFGASGKQFRVGVPDKKDMPEGRQASDITISPMNSLLVCLKSMTSYARFDGDLKRCTNVHVRIDPMTQRLLSRSEDNLCCWIRGNQGVYLLKGLQDVIRKVDRRKDGNWLGHPNAIGMAQDGSVAVLAKTRQVEGLFVCTYSSNGDARSSFQIPYQWHYGIAYDGERIFFEDGTDVVFYQADGRPGGRFSLGIRKDMAGNFVGPYLAANGRQLWFVDVKEMTLYKYAIPAKTPTGGSAPEK